MRKYFSLRLSLVFSLSHLSVSFSSDLEILGHRITPVGRFPISKGTNAITNMPRAHNVSAVKRFLGMVGYFRDSIRSMSMRTKFLRSLLQKGIPFVWTSNLA